MDKHKVLAKLIWDLQSFLSVLDSETLSYIAQAQKKSISELLSSLQTPDTPVEDAEYMIMSCPSSSSPSNELSDTVDILSSELVSPAWLRNILQGPAAPPLPPGGLEDDDDDEDTYEEAAPYVADTTKNNTEKPDSDSSHYESYGDDDDDDDDEDEEETAGPVKDRAHYLQLSASQPCLMPSPEARLCGYIWRRKWLGQWTKQLFFIKNHTLMCYKCAQDLLPSLSLSLFGCQLVYKSKPRGKIQHRIRLVLTGAETLVLGYNSYEQADEWRRVIEEISVGGEAEMKSNKLLSCRSSSALTECEEEKPLVGDQRKDKGVVSVLMNCQWQSLVCRVEAGLLNMFAQTQEEVGSVTSPQYTVRLTGCDVTAGPDTERSHRITLSKTGDQLAVLEVSSSGEKERWLKLLQDGAVNHSHHDNNTQKHSTGVALSGLQTHRFPPCSSYMDPFGQRDQPVYSNTSVLEHMLHSSQDSVRCSSVSSRDSVTYSNAVFTSHSRRCVEVERSVQKLELTGRAPLRGAESEINLHSATKQNKRTFRQSLAVCSERAQVSFLNPLLRRTASAKTSLRRAPSALFIEHGKVFQRRKEWETKAAA